MMSQPSRLFSSLLFSAVLLSSPLRGDEVHAGQGTAPAIPNVEAMPSVPAPPPPPAPAVSPPAPELLTVPPPPGHSADNPDLAGLKEQLQQANDRTRFAEEEVSTNRHLARLMNVFCLFAIPAAFVVGFFFARYKNYQQLNETLRALLERGIQIPPELLTPTPGKGLGWSDFRKGIMFAWLGVSAMFFLSVSFHGDAWSIGLVPFFIGGAYLLLWFMDRRKQLPK